MTSKVLPSGLHKATSTHPQSTPDQLHSKQIVYRPTLIPSKENLTRSESQSATEYSTATKTNRHTHTLTHIPARQLSEGMRVRKREREREKKEKVEEPGATELRHHLSVR